MPPSPLARFRAIALKLPEAHEVEAWGAPTFRVKNKLFAMYAAPDAHTGGGRPGVWLKATAANQQLMLQFAPRRFFFPPYVGKSGWIGIHLDKGCDWPELRELVRDAWMMSAPRKLDSTLDNTPASQRKKPQR